TQDYALFHFLNEYSLELWERQIELVRQKHGLISILTHPDYILKTKEQETYLQLLHHLDKLRLTENVWITTPMHLNTWWRARSKLSLIRDGSEWRIKGAGSERARLAYARLQDGTISYEIPGSGLPPLIGPPRELELTYDLHAMEAPQILALLPLEFDEWKHTPGTSGLKR
ncbi:MAG: hypothetical protein ACHQ7N_13255, partial [Candidatus Methylomirabilales bacterium]